MEFMSHMAGSRMFRDFGYVAWVICVGSCWTNSGVWRCGDADVVGSCVPNNRWFALDELGVGPY
jgi:hypothetical protein